MRIAIIGGTGLVGTRLVEELDRRGHETVVVARETGADVLTGDGLDGPLDGVEVVVDVLNVVTMDAEESTAFFRTAEEQITAAEQRAGVRHHVLLSIVGLERALDNGYYAGKLAQEGVVTAGAVPFSVLRATQFFEYLGTVADWATQDGVVHLPATLLQPVALDDVVGHLARLAEGEPTRETREIAGPDVGPAHEVVRAALAAAGDQRTIRVVPGQMMGAGSDDALVPHGAHETGTTRFDDWAALAVRS